MYTFISSLTCLSIHLFMFPLAFCTMLVMIYIMHLLCCILSLSLSFLSSLPLLPPPLSLSLSLSLLLTPSLSPSLSSLPPRLSLSLCCCCRCNYFILNFLKMVSCCLGVVWFWFCLLVCVRFVCLFSCPIGRLLYLFIYLFYFIFFFAVVSARCCCCRRYCMLFV